VARGWLLRGLLLSGPVLWLALANLGPLVGMARISLLDTFPAAPDHVPSYSTASYQAFLASPFYLGVFWRSLRFAAGTTVMSLVLTYPLAYHIARHVSPARRIRRLLLLVAPFWTSEVVRTFGIMLLLSNRGAVNIALRWTGLIDEPLPLLYGGFSVGFGMVYVVLLSMLLPLYAALDRLPPNLLVAAADLGAGPWQRFLRVTLPMTKGGIVTGSVLVFLFSLGSFAVPALLGGADMTLFAMTIGSFFGSAAGRWPLGAAFGMILLLAAVVLPLALAGLFRGRLAPGAA